MSKKSKILKKGQKFNKLTVIELSYIKQEKDPKGIIRNKEYYKCQCDCGNISIIRKDNLINGGTQSCGCLSREKARERLKKQNFKHGLSNTKIYRIWATIKDRCFRKNCKDYINYGGRGIIIQNSWLVFINFYNWAIQNGYKEGLTIERIDVNGNYEEKNCTWIENKLQSHNTRQNHYLTYNGKTQIISDWAKEMNLRHGANISSRLKKGWTIEEALTTPIGQKRKII